MALVEPLAMEARRRGSPLAAVRMAGTSPAELAGLGQGAPGRSRTASPATMSQPRSPFRQRHLGATHLQTPRPGVDPPPPRPSPQRYPKQRFLTPFLMRLTLLVSRTCCGTIWEHCDLVIPREAVSRREFRERALWSERKSCEIVEVTESRSASATGFETCSTQTC